MYSPAPSQEAPPLLQQVERRASAPVLRRLLTYLALVAGDTLAVAVAFYLAWYARYSLELGGDVEPFNYVGFDAYLPLAVALAGLLILILHFRAMYRLPRNQSLLDEFGAVLLSAALATMTLYAATTFARYPAESRAAFIYAWLLSALAITLSRLLLRVGRAWLHARGIGTERVLVVGDNNLGRMIMQGLAANLHLGYQVVGFLGEHGLGNFGRFRCLGQVDDLDRVVAGHAIDQVFIALPSAPHEAVLRIIDRCRRGNVPFRLVPDLYEMQLGQVDLDTVYGIPLIGVKDTSIRGWNLLVKRGLDVSISVLGLVLSSLPMLLIALLIELDSPGGVLYRQVRVGKGGKPFAMYKFRSMRQGAEREQALLRPLSVTDGPTFKLPADPRRTRVGRILRRTSLDELPQLWNVLKGEMSLVGPRPPTPDEVAFYAGWHKKRLDVSPGLTGLWQVSGRSALSFDEMVVLDIYYIENWSLGLDLRILLRTLPAVISGGGAF
ncbi:MAG: sugar transferase [Chloroflexi bacterium]|nr:sugar transferase [Chloroflexota bacterium]